MSNSAVKRCKLPSIVVDQRNISEKNKLEAKVSDILKNKIYSLNYKAYNKKKITCSKDYKLIKLSEISDINIGSTPSTKNYKFWENGNIPWVSVSELNNTTIYNTKKHLTKETMIIVTHRMAPLSLVDRIIVLDSLSIDKKVSISPFFHSKV